MQQLNAEGTQDSSGNTLYLRFASTIFTYLFRQVANEQDAEDLLLEVFIAALKEDTLAGLPAERQLAWLRYGDGLRFAEIADMLAKPEGTLRKLLVRALRQLRKRYDQLERGKET
jgi:DNA-directed RNA polymerase specialized sigma24 family protein